MKIKSMSSAIGVTDTDSLPQQMANCYGLDLECLSVAELLPPKPGSAVGAKISPLTLKGKPIKIVLGAIESPVRIMFEPSVFDKNPAVSRLNISYELTDPKHLEFFEALDTKVLNILASRSAVFFSRNL